MNVQNVRVVKQLEIRRLGNTAVNVSQIVILHPGNFWAGASAPKLPGFTEDVATGVGAPGGRRAIKLINLNLAAVTAVVCTWKQVSSFLDGRRKNQLRKRGTVHIATWRPPGGVAVIHGSCSLGVT